MRALATALATTAAAVPLVHTMVEFKDGSHVTGDVRAAKTTVKLGRKSCAVPQGTALAALVKLKPAKLGLTDYGECSKSTKDAAGLYVRSIGKDRAKGQDGWVYKIGRRASSFGAADSTGRRLKSGQSVLWFYCDSDPSREGCQRTLELTAKPTTGRVDFTVKGYDDNGRGVPVEDATVETENVAVKTDANGHASLELGAAKYSFDATADGMVRSFPVEFSVP